MRVDDAYFLSIQSTYHDVEAALYHHEMILEMCVIKKINASADLIPSLDELFKTYNLKIDDLSFIAVNQGPAPFTTLRVVIASMNGISFATNIALIGIDGLEALLAEYYDPCCLPTVALLDAFANDVYYAIQDSQMAVRKGCMPILFLLEEIAMHYPQQQIRFIGNGASLHKEAIHSVLKDQAIIPEPTVFTCSVAQIARMGLHKWQEQQGLSKQLLPLYLKRQWWQEKSE